VGLPTGIVTFLFTDIEGSTRLWEEYPQQMRQALARHDAILRHTIQSHAGHVFKTMGDAFYAVFSSASEAVRAALDAQGALSAEDWSEVGGLYVRMALHTGRAEEREGDYLGPSLNRVARLLSIGHGGQVLLSEATQAQAGEAEIPGVVLRDMGSHRLKDLFAPERVFQLCHPDLRQEFPPLRSLSALRHNLPVQVTSLIGREREIEEVRQRLAEARLLTLTGSGGVGKTRLALQVAAELTEAYPEGVWLAELASLSDPDLVPQTTAQAIGVREEPGKSLTRTLADTLKDKRLLLVLDNCEHLVDACARLADTLLRSCPEMKVLATSREVLGIAGEVVYPVPSLSLPDPQRPLTPDVLGEYESVRLFAERAAGVAPAFVMTARNAGAVAHVCRQLDGIPLAIELAAARVRALSIEQVAQRLDDRFRLLTGGSRTALPRQQTLRALIDWSYDLLTGPEKRLLSRLSVFAGGWTLAAAEAVCSGEDIEAWEILDLLTSLVNKSLASYEGAGRKFPANGVIRKNDRPQIPARPVPACPHRRRSRHRRRPAPASARGPPPRAPRTPVPPGRRAGRERRHSRAGPREAARDDSVHAGVPTLQKAAPPVLVLPAPKPVAPGPPASG
jgi:predicted ATPase/class 3 adenylate cyclase